MINILNSLLAALLIWFSAAFFPQQEDLEVPEQKIEREISKLFSITDFQLIETDSLAIKCSEEPFSKHFTILNDSTEIGDVYIRRVQTCDPNFCSKEEKVTPVFNLIPNENLEYFDYYFITDTTKYIKSITVYNYEATHGLEVAKRNWLSQFIEKQDEQLIYGETIDAISGATVSAQNFTSEMEYVLDCLSK